jgi:hypothetical protein
MQFYERKIQEGGKAVMQLVEGIMQLLERL